MTFDKVTPASASRDAAVTIADLEQIAEDLRNARIKQVPILPPSSLFPSLDVKGAFEIQRLSVQYAINQHGDRHVGYKLGNIAKVMQDAFGLDHPDYGFLLSSLFHYEGTQLPRKKFIKPYVELEPAFILKSRLRGPNVTVADVINAVDYAVPAVEIIDSRVKNWTIGLEDTLADNGSTGAIILGGTPRRLTELNLSNTRGVLRFEGKEIMSGNTSYILGNPLNAFAWLVNRLVEFDVQFLPGQVIMPGSCLRAMPMDEPGHWSCTFEEWGTVEFDVI
ncbi:2-keto-4-pentenoate hydratase 2 [Paramyrothecium foliicola]|nr:2-keto-4-pentenoate hydratase 2 [Paramyrothecium foliicola]